MKETMKDTLDLLKQLIAIPSLSRQENDCADFLEKYLSERGQKVNRVGNNLWCMASYDPSRPTILLNSHIDTVPASDSWTRPAFQATVEGDRLYGLGSNDAGAPLVCLVATYLKLCDTQQSYNLVLGLSCEEEVTGKGGIETLIPQLPPVDFALVGEPTGLKAAIAEKGLMVLDCTAHGQSGHAAHQNGDNAIYKAMKDIEWFRTAQLPGISELLGPVRMTVTIVNAGSKHNVIPDTCTFTVDVRSNECYTNEQLFDYISSQVSCEVKARSFRLSSSGIDPSHPAVERCRQLHLPLFGSPTLSDQSRMPFASFKLGPGETTRSHTADEFVCLSELEAGLKVYMDLLDGLSLG